MRKSIVRRILEHYFRDVIDPINDLETGVNVLVNSPTYVHAAEVGFNGVEGRKRIFAELIGAGKIKTILETGTYLGDTSGYMATASGVPVLTCEYNKKLYSLAKMRLKDLTSVELYNMDSRAFLRELAKNKEITENECFIYLDAHWGKDLPLKEELEIIASCWSKFVIMIDDFQVPDDDGYVHDKYGTLKFIGMPELKAKYNLSCYFPKMRAAEEPKPPTGCLVLARNDSYGACLQRVQSLRVYQD